MAFDLSHLNPEQNEAASHFEGPLLVLAGAGSGKTRVLTSRITWLVDEMGVDPAGILALTFTNKAAGEMRERVRSMLGRELAGMWIGTFHSVGVRILRRDAPKLGWSPSFTVYDADDQDALIKRIIRDQLKLDLKKWPPRAIHSAISAAKNELTGPQEYAEGANDAFERVVADVYPRYQQALKDANAFDFDDLLVKPVELLRTHPHVLRRYQDRFRFLLVDEYQDTNRAQYVFLQLMAAEARNLFVVGDDDQSIYGWRGADIRNILDFEKDFPDSRIVRLEQNYRSSANILDAANRVISHNVNRKGKTLRTDAAAGERITLVEAADESDEARWVAEEIQARMADDARLSLRHFVILYRTNAQSRAMEEGLRREGMPYRVIGGTRFYERREVKDALAYLRLVSNASADEAFLRIVNVPRRGIGDASVTRLAEHAAARRIPLLAAAAEAGSVDGIRGVAAKALPELSALIGKYAALASLEGVELDQLLRELVLESGLVEALKAEGPEGKDRLANLDELIAGAAEIQRRLVDEDPELMMELEDAGETSPRPLDLFLGHVALVADVDQHDPTADAVSMMTLHNAKGLEFPFVFISGMEDGLFPLIRAYDEPEDLEEERRLFYVGVTRAERKLYLVHAKRRRRGAQYMDSAPSPFLESVPEDLTETRKTPRILERSSSWSQPWKQGGSYTSRRERLFGGDSAWGGGKKKDDGDDSGYQVDYADSQDAPSLRKGARVRHPTFGSGTVKELTGYGNDVKAAIEFDSVGRKTVVVRYANLESETDWD
ncbi:ATP-dependent helicase [Longimicrobium terrae]|uniref:DNA 3'-5' helicase n=1 Tax=Longimicrobium terrae TaxID=1639882 RepID=A0A841GW31_9BACT|nr:UvrD-helicase domain-containing protein [Longimicrobium terrae]MBB4635744.1 DNA helicase-2/ATP-dependent DNA helicase PcrA [Longimicrobium terrae]MBB6070138.1 DNA helicase-2/ATP-dependent DNA helicase PcrA [Longimicrobium terrae]NNC33039.1 UvrD-helicase domain-containing protein [Longimicrobium terrae]